MQSISAGQSSLPALGAVFDGHGVRFSLYSEHAQSVELCLFMQAGDGERRHIELARGDASIWSVYVPGLKPGQRYGFRVHGEYAPAKGHFYNPQKLLIDPYAYCLDRAMTWSDGWLGYDAAQGYRVPDVVDNAKVAAKSVVVDHRFDWEGDYPLRIPVEDSIIYELHVKGFTQLHPEVPKRYSGTYEGLASPAVIRYLQDLGITAVELMPCMASVSNKRLARLGLDNYWGYDPIALFAPDRRFALEDPVVEFKRMVKALHQAGIEVILDVVFNHTGEADAMGPTLSFRGIDNRTYYRLNLDAPSRYLDSSGCGNSINTEHPYVGNMLLDCLRYWVTEMHVDGFRFDLASSMARENGGFNSQAWLLAAIEDDPVLSFTKMIVEPWDLGFGGYQLGQFPERWCEWNDRYRDSVRRYWRGDENQLPGMVKRITGSADIFKPRSRPPQASINFVTSHDGFTLRDLVSYEHKHNQANGEHNRDGHNENYSVNYGEEGETESSAINAARLRQQKNLLATLLLSSGTPMLSAGDEINRTQGGNNNAYCQDNPVSWLDWALAEPAQSLLRFVQSLIQIRQTYPVLTRSRHADGRLLAALGYRDIEWLRPDGLPMSQVDWTMPFARCLTILLPDADGSLVWIINAADTEIECRLPPASANSGWKRLFDTALEHDEGLVDGMHYLISAHATALFVEEQFALSYTD